jgi:hypothetical protein
MIVAEVERGQSLCQKVKMCVREISRNWRFTLLFNKAAPRCRVASSLIMVLESLSVLSVCIRKFRFNKRD